MAEIKIRKARNPEILLNLSLLFMFLYGAHILAPSCQQIMNKRPTIPRIIFTAYIPTTTEMSLLKTH
jgi:hypothetical protein